MQYYISCENFKTNQKCILGYKVIILNSYKKFQNKPETYVRRVQSDNLIELRKK